MARTAVCQKCLFFIDSLEDVWQCIHPNNIYDRTPSELNRDNRCEWYEYAKRGVKVFE